MGIPALSQSRQALLSCPHRYCQEQIFHQKQVTGEAARRGNVIHEFLRAYVQHLVKTKYKKDLAYFEHLLKGLDPGARELLEPMQESFEIDPETVFATEMRIAMTEAFVAIPAGLPGAAFEGTLDLVLLHEEVVAQIIDWKSQFQAIDADSFQGRLYSLMLMQLNPQIEQCEFQLRFLRWGKERSAIYTREQIPELEKEVTRWRERQIALHKEAAKAEAFPGPQCAYCSLLCNGCPIEANPYGGVESYLRAAIYHKMSYDKAREVLKAHCDEGGPVRVKDGIGTEYEAAFGVTERKRFGLDCLPPVVEWCKRTKDDLLAKITLSGLSGPLKAKKRSDLLDVLADHIEMETRPRFHIGKCGDTEDDNGTE